MLVGRRMSAEAAAAAAVAAHKLPTTRQSR